jgi:DNA polymerase I-like protein with 3'-5' exonuclease and polymerase domains
MGRRLAWDVESDGFLETLTRVHCLCIEDVDTGETWAFRQNDRENTILDGVAMLNEADLIIGHSSVSFDAPAMWKVYGGLFAPKGRQRDTLVCARMTHADIKDSDIRLWKAGKLDGKNINSHQLAAWGQRLDFPKDDYSARMIAAGLDPWAQWSQEMEDYCAVDVRVTVLLWKLIEEKKWSERAMVLEHRVHELCDRITRNGFPFDLNAARLLERELRQDVETKTKEAIDHFGSWWRPQKILKCGETTSYVVPGVGLVKGGKKFQPREEFGEDYSRRSWAEVQVPARDFPKLGRMAGCPFTPIELQEFNPGSRPQIVDRLTTIHDWVPTAFTEKKNAKVDDDILRELGKTIPVAEALAEIFYLRKRLGQLADGEVAWIKKAVESSDGFIHGRIVCGGTITNRASHSSPNVAQVPKVKAKKIEGLKTILMGRAGDHGYECRKLFTVPPGWVLMGADQQGIELRALAHFIAEFDGGEYAKIVLEGDPHGLHQEMMELASRDTAKTFLYAMLYGSGDENLGGIVDPSLIGKPHLASKLGAEMKRRLMTRIPAFGKLVKAVQAEAKRGFVTGLDGRRLYVRSSHAALNTKLQGCGATLAKAWLAIFEELCEEAGLNHGWNGDFAILGWIHDEIQVAVRDDPKTREIAERCIIQAALEAGNTFDFQLPVEVEVKFGANWAETH